MSTAIETLPNITFNIKKFKGQFFSTNSPQSQHKNELKRDESMLKVIYFFCLLRLGNFSHQLISSRFIMISSLFHNSLGYPVPFDDHAVSVLLPLWAHVVGYEEGDSSVVSAMQSGYPRFKISSSVEHLTKLLINQKESKRNNDTQEKLTCFCFPTIHVANRFYNFLLKALHLQKEIYESSDIFVEVVGSADSAEENELVTAVFFPHKYFKIGKAFWQHTGEIISSRQAEDVLIDLGHVPPDLTVFCLADCLTSNCSSNHSGMKRKRCCFSDKVINDLSSNINGHNKNMKRKYLISCARDAKQTIKSRLATYLKIENISNYVTLTVSGMSSIYAALRLAQLEFIKQNHPTNISSYLESNYTQALEDTGIVVFGFPYIDTLKMMQRPELNPGVCHFYGRGDSNDLIELEHLLQKQHREKSKNKIIALFTEFPSNPLLYAPDLKKLSNLAKTYDFMLIVDDTISTCANIDLVNCKLAEVEVDILCSSLTKSFNGRGDVMAGSLIINPNGRKGNTLLPLIDDLKLPSLYYSDALTLEVNSRDFLVRLNKINKTTLELVNWFNTYVPYIQNVYYPTVNSDVKTHYDLVLRNSEESQCTEMKAINFKPGYSCLFSVVFKETPKFCVKIFYDAMHLSKGPSLGTNFTLVCPYTLLAHYYELPWAKNFGVDKGLIRISVGLEDIDILKSTFTSAINSAVHPLTWRLLQSTQAKNTRAIAIILDFLFPTPWAN